MRQDKLYYVDSTGGEFNHTHIMLFQVKLQSKANVVLSPLSSLT